MGELKGRMRWFVRLRWCFPPAILAMFGAAALLGYRFNAPAILLIAGFILCFNLAFRMELWRMGAAAWDDPARIRPFIYWQLGLDYGAIFLLIHFTGGIDSPLLYFCVFPVLFAAGTLPGAWVYGAATAAITGVALIGLLKYGGWVQHHAMTLDAGPTPVPLPALVSGLLFFSATMLITAHLSATVMRVFFRRVQQLAVQSESLAAFNERFNALFSMVKAIGAIRHMEQVLEVATRDMAMVMGVKAISVKLLSEDGKHLVYKGSHGLPPEFVKRHMVAVAESPLNRLVMEGEPFVTGDVGRHEMFQFGEDLAFAKIRSVLFVPIGVERRVIGVLGAYCVQPDRFSGDDIEFFRLAAGLVGIGIDNSRSYEAIEAFTAERTRFMLRVAHNLRAPLAAVLSMLELLREGHIGELNDAQSEYLRRVDRRTRTMLDMINELLALSTSRTAHEKPEKRPLDTAWLAGRLERTFQDEAAERGILFSVTMDDPLPPILGNAEQIEQLLENVASNAIKYTAPGGRAEVAFANMPGGMVAITVRDSGIGIPEADMHRLFTEFFRAENARNKEELGTGLGLAIVKEIVDAHRGQIAVESREGEGTTFVITLPAAMVEEVR